MDHPGRSAGRSFGARPRKESTMVDKSNDRPGGSGTGGLSRRELLAGAGGVVLAGTLAACGGGGRSSPASGGGTPTGASKRGGNFRLGVTGRHARRLVAAPYDLPKRSP